MCSTIAAATMSRSGVCEGLLFSADLEPQCKAHVVAQSSVTVGQGTGAVKDKERTEVKVPDREPNGPLSVLSWRYSLHADANLFSGSENMWLALTATVLAAAIGFNVLAIAIQRFEG
jgi:hypothetical protein